MDPGILRVGLKIHKGYDLLILPDHLFILFFLIFPKIPHKNETILVQSEPPEHPSQWYRTLGGGGGRACFKVITILLDICRGV